ncbi:unnamed protein product [Protopolystoma xenopodis]|uniref:Uncharacterized protein n=1 Tax=Protopolystoma xenopodis TaxID=117903 RepID=A0A448XAY5_9PLAT|nr:unnamed protein product [Protopolystoma xenopodis]
MTNFKNGLFGSEKYLLLGTVLFLVVYCQFLPTILASRGRPKSNVPDLAFSLLFRNQRNHREYAPLWPNFNASGHWANQIVRLTYQYPHVLQRPIEEVKLLKLNSKVDKKLEQIFTTVGDKSSDDTRKEYFTAGSLYVRTYLAKVLASFNS